LEGVEGIGKRLKILREENNMRQVDLAIEFHISNPNTISMYERDKRRPSLETICMYSEKFKVSIDWIIKGSDYDYSEMIADYKCGEVMRIYLSLHDKAIMDVAVNQLLALQQLRNITN